MMRIIVFALQKFYKTVEIRSRPSVRMEFENSDYARSRQCYGPLILDDDNPFNMTVFVFRNAQFGSFRPKHIEGKASEFEYVNKLESIQATYADFKLEEKHLSLADRRKEQQLIIALASAYLEEVVA